MSGKALTLLLLVCELPQSESTCACPSSHPDCEDGKCWFRSEDSWSYTTVSCGSCKSNNVQEKLKDSAKGSIGRCYSYFGNSGEWCYTQAKGGAFVSSACESYNGYGTEWCCPEKYRCHEAKAELHYGMIPTDKKLRDSAKGSIGRCYSYYGSKDKNEWCYTRKKDLSFATSGCGSYDGYETTWCCPEKYECSASGASSSGCNPSALGKYIADFVKNKKNKKVYSDKQGSASCWDLAWAAMEQADKKGYNPVFYQKESGWDDSYAWSSKTVPIEEAQPGDIAQFEGWEEPSRYAWNPHTAVVTECYKDGDLTTYDQNPSPVEKSVYHPHQKTSGSVKIYRLQTSSRLRLYSQTPQLSVPVLFSGRQFSALAGVCAIAVLLVVASVIVKRQRSWRVHDEAQSELEEGPLLEVNPMTSNLERAEVPADI